MKGGSSLAYAIPHSLRIHRSLSSENGQEQLAQYIEPMWQEGIQADIKVLMGSTFLEVTREVLRDANHW